MVGKIAKSTTRLARALRHYGRKRALLKCAVATSVMFLPSAVQAQGIFDEALKGLSRDLAQQSQQRTTTKRERDELLARIAFYIRSNPEAACRLPQSDIERYLAAEVDRHGLMSNVSQTVFGRGGSSGNAMSGLEALNEKTRQETARRYARSQAVMRGEEAPVGNQDLPVEIQYSAQLFEISAVERIENGLKCVAEAHLEQLRFPVAYDLYLNPDDADGWSARGSFPAFTEADALSETSVIRVNFAGTLLSLGEARAQAQSNRASALASREDERQRELAREAYLRSPAGRADALRQRQAMVAKQKACETNGGTWGARFDSNTIIRVNASDVGGLFSILQACYFLGR